MNNTARTSLTLPWTGESIAYTLYVGPKETQALNAVDPVFDRAIDFGWFHFIARPLISLLRLSHSLTGNYGLDIILLTVLVKLLFFPLSNKSFQSMAAMKKLQPRMERLRERYKDDRQKLNQETMELYKRNKVNPLGGCLPMLVQFPVFIGLYQGLMYAIELRQAPFFGWISDLSSPRPTRQPGDPLCRSSWPAHPDPVHGRIDAVAAVDDAHDNRRSASAENDDADAGDLHRDVC